MAETKTKVPPMDAALKDVSDIVGTLHRRLKVCPQDDYNMIASMLELAGKQFRQSAFWLKHEYRSPIEQAFKEDKIRKKGIM